MYGILRISHKQWEGAGGRAAEAIFQVVVGKLTSYLDPDWEPRSGQENPCPSDYNRVHNGPLLHSPSGNWIAVNKRRSCLHGSVGDPHYSCCPG